MNKEQYMECERRSLIKWVNFRLPVVYYKIGMGVVLAAIATMFIRAFAIDGDTEMIKEVTRKSLLIGLLLMSLARDKEEDELIVKLRMQSYTWAFVVGVAYALIMPFVEFGVDSVLNQDAESFKDLGDFQVLVFMLMIQLMSFHVLKRYR